jgi:phage repressor protein C with HTH and peptisase S24 domain
VPDERLFHAPDDTSEIRKSNSNFGNANWKEKPDMSGMSDLQKIVIGRLAEIGRGPGTAERLGGLKKNYISDITRGHKRDVRAANLPALARALDWTVEDLRAAGVETAPSPSTVVPADDVTIPLIATLPKDLPVRGVAAGAIVGAFSIDGIIDWVRRPPGLSHTTNAYALYVAGTSMIPKFEPGDLIFVNPDRPAGPGDPVIIQTRRYPGDDIQAWVKILVRVTHDTVTVRQLNPESTIDHRRDQVVGIHRVVRTSEMFGV